LISKLFFAFDLLTIETQMILVKEDCSKVQFFQKI